MCRIASLFLLQRLKGSMSGDTRDFNNMETRVVIKFFFLARQGADLYHPPYSPDLVPSDYHLFPGLKRKIEKSPFFVRRGGHCCRGDLVGRTTF